MFLELNDVHRTDVAARHRDQVQHEGNHQLIAVAGGCPDAGQFASVQTMRILEDVDGRWFEVEITQVRQRTAPEIEARVLPGRDLDESRKGAAGKHVAMNEQPVARPEGVQEGARSPIAVHNLQKHGIEV